MATAEPADGGSGNLKEYSVSELSGAVKRTIEDGFGYVRVRGELGRVSRSGNGHCYLDLKDERAVLSSVIWKGGWSRLKVKPEQGMEVIATGRMTTFAGQSRYQLVIDTLEPAGAGALMALFEARKKALEAEGLFAAERKRPLPPMPQVIGVVTSPTGAVIRDILHRLRDRFPVHVLVWPAVVQGEQCPKSVVAGVEGFNALPTDGPVPRPDVLIVARGGGSLEDLWGFNDEAVARAVAASSIPVISAIGHETDVTLIDYVADRRAPTPTAAAEMAVPVRMDLSGRLDALNVRLTQRIGHHLEAQSLALQSAARGLGRKESLIEPAEQRFDRAVSHLTQSLKVRVERATQRMERAAGGLSAALVTAAVAMKAETLKGMSQRLITAPPRRWEQARSKVISARLSPHLVRRSLDRGGEEVKKIGGRLGRLTRENVDRKSARLDDQARLLHSLSYQGVLARGFALVLDESQGVIRSPRQMRAGETYHLRFAEGEVPVRHLIEGETKGPAAASSAARKTPQAKTSRKSDGSQRGEPSSSDGGSLPPQASLFGDET
ncbi:Exonuclease VII, large subunit [Parvularcula bermudensis HTCC2503]|uniref:Exodeoxyribonuclease 7 large subunit n=1 Tax=Parvularcula bermudensis (strain ATCC BAA-594 / HTCC2503 / KCTC 12087) TaxID=314260 RepID=E0TCQ9_PARBH|nr:exodeoxyribonuclease VII large subunit [Parvularcula bermudensis]ADM08648.1 Exonuclease VII, large subunit [Parvularcula bermudensis HTCC2503]